MDFPQTSVGTGWDSETHNCDVADRLLRQLPKLLKQDKLIQLWRYRLGVQDAALSRR